MPSVYVREPLGAGDRLEVSYTKAQRRLIYTSCGAPSTMQPKRLPRVLGPYREGHRFRVITIHPEGRRSFIAHTEAQAREILRRASLRLAMDAPPSRPPPIPTLSVALQEYERWLASSQMRSIQTVRL